MIVSLIVSITLAAAVTEEGVAVATPAEAATPTETATPAAAAPAATPAVDRDQEVICKKEAKTASRTPSKKVCQTRAQWRAEETRGGVQTRTRN